MTADRASSLGPAAHVVYVVPVLQPAGAERLVAELARRMPAEGFTTSVICLETENAPIGRELIAAGVTVRGLHVHRRRSLAAAAALLNALPKNRPLIIHSHLFHANLASRLAVRKMCDAQRESVRVISTIHVVERRRRPWQFIFDRWTSRYAACEVCVSHAVARFHQSRTRLPASFFRVIENGIDLSPFLNAPPRPLRSAIDRPHVVSIGRLDPQKDYPTLLNAWASVCGAFPNSRLSIAGQGPERQRLQQLCDALKLTNVEFPGFINNTPGLLRDADLYVQSSAWEGFGLAVAEAMASGLPVIVTDVDSLPELVTQNQTGIVVPAANPVALGRAIVELIRDPAKSAALAAAAKSEAIGRFGIERMVSDYAKLYRKTLALHGDR